MKIAAFKVEEWMNAYETKCTANIAETCVDSVSLQELCNLTGNSSESFWKDIANTRLTYGYIEGNPAFLHGITSLYQTIKPEHIVPTHGAAGANHLLISALVEPNDHVITILPTYQQLYSIPESIGAETTTLSLHKTKNSYEFNLDELANAIKPNTKLICLNNPNNPTGTLLPLKTLQAIVNLAQKHDIYLLCDEVYRHLTQTDDYSPSIADLYNKGISISSMSKVFSLAGLRLGWIATKDEKLRKQLFSHRDYNTISCSLLDEKIAALALNHKDILLKRNRQIVRTNLVILDAWVNTEPKVSYIKPQAGTTALLYFEGIADTVQFCKNLLTETGALLTPGEAFEIPGSARIGYACDKKELKRGLEVLHHFLAKQA